MTSHFFILTKDGKDIAMADYGPAWKFHRKIFVTALRQYLTDIPLIEGRITKQAQGILQHFDQQEGKSFDPKSILNSAVANVISEITFGEEYDASHPGIKRMVDLSIEISSDKSFMTWVLTLDMFPIVRHFPLPVYKKARKLMDMAIDPSRQILKDLEQKFDPEEPVNNLTAGK